MKGFGTMRINHKGTFLPALVCLIMPCVYLFFGNPSYAVESASEILATLKSRDEQFDNAQLKYSTSAIIKDQGFPTWSFPGLAEEMHLPPESLGPSEQEAKYNEQLIVRSNEVTFIREIDPALFPDEIKPGMVLPTPFTKWSNTEGIQRQITNNFPSSYSRRDMTLEIMAAGREGDISQEQRMEVEFACGFGFGKRITSIERITPKEGGVEIEGSIQLWRHDKSTFRITLNDDYVVREAHIEAFVDPAMNIIDINTKGTKHTEELKVAEEGLYKRVMWGIVDGKMVGKEKPIKEFSVKVQDIQFHLSDQNYNDLTSMDVPDGTYIMDKITGVNHVKGKGSPPVRLDDFLGRMDLAIQESAVSTPRPVEPDRPQAQLSQDETPQTQGLEAERANLADSSGARPWIIISCLLLVAFMVVIVLIIRKSRKGGR